MHYILALSEQEGVFGVIAYKKGVSNNQENIVLKEIFVDENNRSHGIGAMLIEEFEEVANNLPKQLLVYSGNISAIKFYRRQNYEILNDSSSQILMGKV